MTKILLMAVLAAAGITLVLQALWPQGAEASTSPPSPASASFSLLVLALPSPQEPFDLTPITPVESAGASMDRH